jgi:hypothetical protein
MPTINQLVGQWRKWINRSKSFDGKELDELENHLLEEIDYLTEKDGLLLAIKNHLPISNQIE